MGFSCCIMPYLEAIKALIVKMIFMCTNKYFIIFYLIFISDFYHYCDLLFEQLDFTYLGVFTTTWGVYYHLKLDLLICVYGRGRLYLSKNTHLMCADIFTPPHPKFPPGVVCGRFRTQHLFSMVAQCFMKNSDWC